MSTTILVEGDGESFRVTINAEEAGGDTPDPPVIDVTNGLYAYYTFEDAIMDQTETELTGIGIGSSFVDSYNGTKALKIPAKESAYLSIPDGLVDQKKMSISFWVKGLSDGHIFHVVRAEGRILFQTMLSLKSSRRQCITVYKIYLIFFIHDRSSLMQKSCQRV
mgnify:CR=1 FL=1